MENILIIGRALLEIVLALVAIGSLQNNKVNSEEKKNGARVAIFLFLIANLILYVSNVLLGQESKAVIGMLDAVSIISVIYLIAYGYFLSYKKKLVKKPVNH